MKIGVKILPRNEVLDTQGRAVEKILKQNDFQKVSCRVGRFVELTFETEKKDEALLQAKRISEFVLHNPLIEDYKLTVIEE